MDYILGWFFSVGETAAVPFVGVSKSFFLPNGWFDVNGYRDVCPGRQGATGCHLGPDTIRFRQQNGWYYLAPSVIMGLGGSVPIPGGGNPTVSTGVL